MSALIACGLGVVGGLSGRSGDERVDMIELNHFFDPKGQHVYDQVIFYQIAPETGKFHVRAWCLIEDRETLSRRPLKNQETQQYEVTWFDDQRILRHITSSQFRESWTQVDPERADKKFREERARIALIQSPQRIQAERQAQSEIRQQEELLAEQAVKNENATGDASTGVFLVSKR